MAFTPNLRNLFGEATSAAGPGAPSTPAASETTSPPATGQVVDFNAPLSDAEKQELRAWAQANLSHLAKNPEEMGQAMAQKEQELRQRRAGSATSSFYSQADELAKKLGEGGYDQEKYERYSEELTAPIEAKQMEMATSVSQYLARQGLGGSGINVAAHGGLANNAAALESSARRQALGMAENAQRQELLDEYSTRLSSMGPVLQKYGIDVNAYIEMMRMRIAQQMAEDQAQNQTMSGLGGLLGYGVGSYMYPGMGGQVGYATGSKLGGGM